MSATETDEAVEAEIVAAMGDDGDAPAVDPETGEILVRCEAETTVGGSTFQCALPAQHEGDHAFQATTDAPPPPEDSAKKMREAGEKLDRESERHWNRIKEIMGDDADGLTPCELCFVKTPGFRWDAAPNEETTNRVRIAIGLPDVSNYAPSATERQCDDCRGLGKVRTGSTVTGEETASCDACKGKGYVSTRERLNTPVATPEQPVEANGTPAFPDDGIERDMFGTPSTDPDYGKMPNMRARPVDYWQTAQA